MSSIYLARSYLYYTLVPLTLPQVVSRKYQDIHSSLIVNLTMSDDWISRYPLITDYKIDIPHSPTSSILHLCTRI